MKILSILIPTVLFLSSCAFNKSNTTQQSNRSTYKNERIVLLDNGLKVYFVHDESLPQITLQMLIPVGNSYEPQGLEGLNTMSALS